MLWEQVVLWEQMVPLHDHNLGVVEVLETSVVVIMVDVFPKYTYTKSGTYYFSKTVPRDLKPYYTRNRIIICLKTKSAKKAELSSKSLLSKLENYWLGLRLTHTAVR